MTDTLQDQLLAAFRTRLESDPQLQREFMANPLAVFKRAGVQVSPAKAQRLQKEFKHGGVADLRPSGFKARRFDMNAKRPK